MALRVVVENEGRTTRVLLRQGVSLVGSAEDTDVRIGDPAVSRRHARLRVEDGLVWVQDLDSRNGTRVDGERLAAESPLEIGQELRFGPVKAFLEEVADDDLLPAVDFDDGKSVSEPVVVDTPSAPRTTLSVGSLTRFSLQRLPALLRRMEAGEDYEEVARACGVALLEGLPCETVEVRSVIGDGGVLFTAQRRSELAPESERSPALARNDRVEVEVSFRDARPARSFAPLVDACASLIALSRDRAGQAPGPAKVMPPAPAAALPDPPSVVPEMRRIYTAAERVAQGDVGVMITGDSGTGKEVLARFIHAASTRTSDKFIALNCAALPRDLLEAELFGVEKGAATGVDSRPGRFELADGGTLFLDEIGDMAPETQARILRVLQEGEVYRLGSTQPRSASVRVIAATNRDLDRLMADGTFRSDLYHRISDWRVALPPLRSRRADIPNLAAYFLRREAEKQGRRLGGISRGALNALLAHPWPGNVRQLEREMARAVLFLEEGSLLERRHLQLDTDDGRPAGTLKERLDSFERTEIEQELAQHGGDVAATAQSLGIGRSTLYKRLKDLGLGETS